MLRAFRIGLITLASVVVLFFAVLGVVATCVDANRFKPIISERIQWMTGYPLTFQGDLRWSIFPSLGLETQGVVVGDVRNPLLWVDTLKATIPWGPLFVGKLFLGLRGKLSRVDVAQLLQKTVGRSPISGKGEGEFDLSMRADDRQRWLETTNGAFEFHILNGQLRGIDLLHWVRAGQSLLKWQAMRASSAGTSFSTLSGTAKIRAGVVDNRDLSLTSPLITATGAGTVDLAQRQIDYRLQLSPAASPKVVVPIEVGGAFNRVRVSMVRGIASLVVRQIQSEKGQKWVGSALQSAKEGVHHLFSLAH